MDPNDLSERYNTALTPEEEAQFLASPEGKQGAYDYDMRGAWKAGVVKAGNGHYPDTFKKPNHPTFSAESQYNGMESQGGKWEDQPDGTYVFKAAASKYHTPERLQEYFTKYEPGNKLVLPEAPTALAALDAALSKGPPARNHARITGKETQP